MDSPEFAVNRTVLSEEGEEYIVQDVILGGSGNNWLVVSQNPQTGVSTLLLEGHVRDTFFPVEPEEPVDTRPAVLAQEEAERKRNAKREEKARAKKAKKAKAKKAAKEEAPTAKAKPRAGKKPPKPPTTGSVPGPAAVSK